MAGGPRCHGTVGAVGDVLDDDGVFASAAKVARIAGELVVGYLGVQIAEAQVDDPVGIGTHHAFDLDAIDIGADIVVDRGAGDNLAELKFLILDRKSVEEGKSVSVRINLGGRRIIKKK